MDADGKRKEIQAVYGSEYFRGRYLRDMPDKQIHAIYGQLTHSGIFEEYEALKDSYVGLFPNAHYIARRRANKLSIFDLRRIIPEVIKDKEKNFPEGYQFTLMDWLNELEGKEHENGNSTETQTEKQPEASEG